MGLLKRFNIGVLQMNRPRRGYFCATSLVAVFAAGCLSFLSCAPVAAQTVLRDGWRVASSAQISASGGQISEPGFSTQGWYATSVPKTVFAALVENGVYKNPYFGMNLRALPGVEYKLGGQFANEEMPATSPFAAPWWYRNEFAVPAADKGKQIWMEFRGINYRAEI